MSKDIKALLKEARDAIKTKDYETSLKLSKQILREKRDNYTALLFLGVSLQETGQFEQALKAFRAAIKIDPNNPLAWNGLINYYEKMIESKDTTTTTTKSELLQCYMSLFKIETNEKKLVEYCEKLCKFNCDNADAEQIIQITTEILKLIECGKLKDYNNQLNCCLFDFLSKCKNLPKELEDSYEKLLIEILNNPKIVTIQHFSEYLNLLNKQQRYTELIGNAEKMHSLFELDTISLKWICKIFNQTFIENDELLKQPSLENIRNYCSHLLNLDKKSSIGQLTQCILLILDNDGQSNHVKDLLKELINLYPISTTTQFARVLLMKISIKLHHLQDAINAFNQIEKSTNDKLKQLVRPLIIEALSRSDRDEDLYKVIELEKTLSDSDLNQLLPHIIRTYINLNRFDETMELLKQLDKECMDFKLLNAQLLHRQNRLNEALNILETTPPTNDQRKLSEWWLEIGKMYLKLEQYEKCLQPLLKAAKFDTNNYQCFLYLGNYYHRYNDVDKARRCYEKSFRLNQQCSEAGIELSRIYRQLKQWDINLQLLQSLTNNNIINKSNSWAWLQLGLHYLEQQQYNDAIRNLRYVIRVDDTNINCWESLADSYLANGAYTSALKCYNKSLELSLTTTSSTKIYSLLQIANIKQILGEYTQARCDFNEILQIDPIYVPALKGIAETCYYQAKQCYREQRFGTCRDHLQFAADKLILAIQQRNDLACLWKLLADCCYYVAIQLPDKYRCLLLPSFTDSKQNQIVENNDLFELSVKCYNKSTTLIDDNLYIWHDMATCLFSYSRYLSKENREKSDELLKRSTTILQYLTVKQPTNWQYWNLLGLCTFYSNNYKLTQHSLIKAIIASNNNSAIAWSNLGVFYLILNHYQLANRAFSQAQRSDPNYVNCWIGQAFLAEFLQHEDAMDLFRHSTQLGWHQQGSLGYAYWVCKTLKQSPLDQRIYSIHNMHAIPVACDNLTWFTEKDPDDPCAWNMLGMLQERMGLNQLATESFCNALYLVNDANDENDRCDLIKINTARLFAKCGKYANATKLYGQVDKATFNSGSGKALALFKDQRYQESYEAYEQALHWLTDEESVQSDVLVALAAMAYMFQGDEAAKILLFQSIQLEKPSPWAYYATLALSILHQDPNLAELVYKEMEALKHRPDCIQHFTIFTCYYNLFQGDPRKSVVRASELVHYHPGQATVWLTLSQLLIRLELNSAAAQCAQNAMKLGQSDSDVGNKIDVTKILCLVSLASFIGKQYKTSLLTAQKAIHCYPNLAENWSVFLLSLLSPFYNHNDTKKLYICDIIKFIELLNCNENLYNWIQVIKKSI